MTRALVCGPSIFEAPNFVHEALTQIDRDVGPITCIIHSQHSQALAWQQWMAGRRRVTHLPILVDYARDGILAQARCRQRLFDAKPDIVVVFQVASNERDERTPTRRPWAEMIALKAADLKIPVFTKVFTESRLPPGPRKKVACRM